MDPIDLQRLAPKVLAGVLPRLYPQMLDVAHAHQDARSPRRQVRQIGRRLAAAPTVVSEAMTACALALSIWMLLAPDIRRIGRPDTEPYPDRAPAWVAD